MAIVNQELSSSCHSEFLNLNGSIKNNVIFAVSN